MSAVTGTFPPDQHSLYSGAHHRTPAPRRRLTTGAFIGIIVAVLAVLAGAGITVAVLLKSSAPPADAQPADNRPPQTVTLGETLDYRTGTISANYVLSPGPALSVTPSGSRPSRGLFLALSATVSVSSGEVYLTDDNFILVTADAVQYEPDVSFLFDGGLRGARAAAGQIARGLVVWDIPPGAEKGAKVQLRLGAAGLRGTWQLP